ncbi:MAG: hypothetical protein COA52_18800 [Hyphomicrobiales bacterium]|nr:hypothetical protein [Hyphomicrobiales bacterium]PCJ83490.1 MAG: hypothetical protein COA52_18800 [Hyphomicrobiales bacterium]
MSLSQLPIHARISSSAYPHKFLRFAKENPSVTKFFFILLVLDLLFIVIFLINGISIALLGSGEKFPPFWSLAADYSAPEFFGYAKLLITSVLLFSVFKRSRIPIFASWAFIFFVLLLDDSLQLHEFGGEWVSGLMPDQQAWYGIQLHHFGELFIWAVLGLICLIVLVTGIVKSKGQASHYTRLFLLAVFGLILCGVVIDLLSSFDFIMHPENQTMMTQILHGVLIVAEDGGELVFMSLAAAIAYFAWLNVQKR